MISHRLISYSFRVEEQLMQRAARVAAERDEKMAQVIRKAIRAYIEASANKGQPKQ